MTDFTNFDAEVDQLNVSLEAARSMTQAFSGELESMRATLAVTGTDLKTLETGLNRGLRSAFDGLVFQGDSLADALKNLSKSIINTTYNAAISPVTKGISNSIVNGLGGLFGGAGFAQGGAFSAGQVMPFAKGGVVSRATTFPMKHGMGLMGEAGPEAIMPLSRGPDGALGVKAQGAKTANMITINISTPDVAGFQRSQSQIAASVSRALGRGQRNT
ncbi:phage tail tape measure protein [Shimia ponticola]|uniref:phage tail tape measure protein n=1 Tax=Shimia ponticola TaxID=2582893 RepID=UPI0011BD8EF7|nr:phage tail tape measure protein [Shimia ponticola]